jgi:hypothetical protein
MRKQIPCGNDKTKGATIRNCFAAIIRAERPVSLDDPTLDGETVMNRAIGFDHRCLPKDLLKARYLLAPRLANRLGKLIWIVYLK